MHASATKTTTTRKPQVHVFALGFYWWCRCGRSRGSSRRGRGQHRQAGRGPVQSLDLRLLVHAQDQSVIRRSQVGTDDVADLVDERRSADSFHVCTAWGLRPNARQIRETADWDIPADRAIDRVDQCVSSPGGACSTAAVMTRSTCSSPITRGRPGRGSSLSASSRSCRNRDRHLPTVAREMPSSPATVLTEFRSAQASTIRDRSATRYQLALAGTAAGSAVATIRRRAPSGPHQPAPRRRPTRSRCARHGRPGSPGASRRDHRGRPRPARGPHRPGCARPGRRPRCRGAA
jgi:hypothetical protein